MAKRSSRSGPLPFSATDIANLARSNPYIERLIEDPDFRRYVSTAVDSGKRAYGRLSNGKVDPQTLLQDRKLHAEIGHALEAARDATIVLIAPRRRRRGLTFGRVVMVGAIGGAVALAASESLRSKVLDVLFGAEEEFEYTPPATPPPSPSPSTTVGAA
jgi:hypothetical protein